MSTRRDLPFFFTTAAEPPRAAGAQLYIMVRSSRDEGSFRTRPLELRVRIGQAAGACVGHRGEDGARDVARLLLHGAVCVERVVARRIGFVIAYVAIEPRLEAGVDEAHPVQPVGQA